MNLEHLHQFTARQAESVTGLGLEGVWKATAYEAALGCRRATPPLGPGTAGDEAIGDAAVGGGGSDRGLGRGDHQGRGGRRPEASLA
jgi:hypothetical protein